MNRRKPPHILPEPPSELKQLSGRLAQRIRERIAGQGAISFAQFMEMALYEPGLGYYSAGLHKFGREGDFVTAPELGDVFAACLARQIAEIEERLGPCDILEIGAGSGKLAAQLLSELPVGASFSSRQRRDGRDVNVAPTKGLKGHSSRVGASFSSRQRRDGRDVNVAPTKGLKGHSSRVGASFSSRPLHDGGQSRAEARSYKILERSADLRAVQKRTLEQHAPDVLDQVEWLDQPPVQPWRGVIVANEVVDALAVERFRIQGGEVRQICVAEQGGRLRLSDCAAPAELAAAVRALGPLPDNYRSEINLQLAPWLAAVTSGMERGVALFIDYGYPRAEYYLPQRRDGTAMAHYRHRAHPGLLRYPGLQDLTAFVDFTALAEAGASAGLEVIGYTSQALFLMACGLEEVVQVRLSGDAEHDMAINNQVRRLTLPGMMGEKFQVLALGRGWPQDEPLRGFAFRDLRNRL